MTGDVPVMGRKLHVNSLEFQSTIANWQTIPVLKGFFTKMDINRVRYFLAITESLNISEAARRLNLSQPALTRAVIKLEQELGATLLRREGKRTHLTPFGKSMLEQFQLLVETDHQTQQLAREYVGGPAQSIKIGVMCTISPTRISQFLTNYRAANQNAQIVLRDITPDKLIDNLLDGHVDCALSATAIENQQRIRAIELYRETMVVAHSRDHPFSTRTSVSLDEIMKEPYLDRLKCEFRGVFNEKCREQNITSESAILCESDEWIHSLIQAGAGVSIMPRESVSQGGLACTPIKGESLQRVVSLAMATGHEDTPAIRVFMQAARNYPW